MNTQIIQQKTHTGEAKNIFASKYQLTLPTPEELQKEIEEERKRIENKDLA